MLLKKNVYAKRNVLICFLNVLKVSFSLILFGRLFHNIGPFTEKALLPYVLRLCRRTTRSLLEEERKDLVGSYLVIMSDI